MTVPAPLRYLAAADVAACLPSVTERLELAERALVGLAAGTAEMPPKLGVHPRPGALVHAMPAWLRDDDAVGVKWIAAYRDNRARGLPAVHGLIVMNDAETGVPVCVMDASVITAVRTAAVSGVAVRLLRPDARSAALVGAGVQARSHLEVLGELLPGLEVVIHDRHPDRADRLADEARGVRGIRSATTAPSAAEAAADVDLVITMAALGTSSQVMTAGWVRDDALVVAVDFATYVSADLARAASTFAVDDRPQFLAYRDAGAFDGFPDPGTTLGELARGGPRGASGLDVVAHLGVGVADVVFGAAVLRVAAERGVGVELVR